MNARNIAAALLKRNINPQAVIEKMTGDKNIMSNPIMQNAVNMYRRGDGDGLREMAENICRERGTTPEEIIRRFNLK